MSEAQAAMREAEEAQAPLAPVAEAEEVKVKDCCLNCQGDNPRLMCTRCKTKYCSPACQRAHWPVHKVLCAELALMVTENESAKAQVKSGLGSVNIRLCQAAQLGRLANCQEIFNEEGVDVNHFAPGVGTCCHLAAQNGHARVLSFLLSRGARPDDFDALGYTALTSAAQNGHELCVNVLLQHGVDVNLSANEDLSRSALSMAAIFGHAPIVALLIAAGAEVDHLCADDVTALHLACKGGKTEVVKLLLAAGADPLHRDIEGYTPLDDATAKNHRAVVALLQARIAEMAREAEEEEARPAGEDA